MDGTRLDPGVAAVFDAARADVVAARRARYRLLERVRDLGEVHAAGATGYRSLSRLIQQLWAVDAGEAARLVADAASLCARTTLTGETLPAELPATAAAAQDGLVGEHHVRVVRRTMEHLERVPGIDPPALEAAEETLAGLAPTLPPKALQKAAHRLVENLDPDGAAPPEDPELGDELLVGKRGDDCLAFTARIHGKVEIEMIEEVLDALSVPAGPEDTRSLAQRRAEALKDLFAQALSPAGIATEGTTGEPAHDTGDAPALDDEPTIPDPRVPTEEPAAPSDRAAPSARAKACPSVTLGGRALLTLTMDARWLQEQIGHGVLDSDTPVHPASARLWACDACVVPAVLGTESQPLDIGRLTRIVPDGMRRALILRDGGCAFPGCTRRPKRCHAHHLKHWVDGGETILENLTLLCRFHHGVIHHDQWSVTMVRGRPWFTAPAWLDPDRIPRPGGRHPVPAAA